MLVAKAKRVENWGLQNNAPAELQQSPIFTDTAEEEIELIPLGCARLRMSCLPVVTTDSMANTWKTVPSDVPADQRVRGIPVPYKVEEAK